MAISASDDMAALYGDACQSREHCWRADMLPKWVNIFYCHAVYWYPNSVIECVIWEESSVVLRFTFLCNQGKCWMQVPTASSSEVFIMFKNGCFSVPLHSSLMSDDPDGEFSPIYYLIKISVAETCGFYPSAFHSAHLRRVWLFLWYIHLLFVEDNSNRTTF